MPRPADNFGGDGSRQGYFPAPSTLNGFPPARGPMSRTCPRCEAGPNQSCRRWIGARVKGEDIGGGYWRRLKRVHADRTKPSTVEEP